MKHETQFSKDILKSEEQTGLSQCTAKGVTPTKHLKCLKGLGLSRKQLEIYKWDLLSESTVCILKDSSLIKLFTYF